MRPLFGFVVLFAGGCITNLPGQAVSFLLPVFPGLSTSRYPLPLKAIAIGDFDSDGKPDVALLSPPNDLGSVIPTVSLGNGDGTFRREQNVGTARFYTVFGMVAADLNGDGKLDLAFAQQAGRDTISLVIYPGNGDGTFGAAKIIPNLNFQLQPYGTVPFGLIVSDLNADGRMDLVLGTTILLGNGDYTFQSLPLLDGTAALCADFNLDGVPDLMLVLNSGSGLV